MDLGPGDMLSPACPLMGYLYRVGFEDLRFGYASAIGAMIFVVTLLLTLLSNSAGRIFQRD